MFLLLSSSIKVLNIKETGEFSSKQRTPNCTLGLSGLCFMMKDEDWFKFKALKMSLLVDSEVVVVRMIERALLAVSDLNSPRFPYQIQKRTTVHFEEDPGRPHWLIRWASSTVIATRNFQWCSVK